MPQKHTNTFWERSGCQPPLFGLSERKFVSFHEYHPKTQHRQRHIGRPYEECVNITLPFWRKHGKEWNWRLFMHWCNNLTYILPGFWTSSQPLDSEIMSTISTQVKWLVAKRPLPMQLAAFAKCFWNPMWRHVFGMERNCWGKPSKISSVYMSMQHRECWGTAVIVFLHDVQPPSFL